ncbi:MAG: M23 family metallopeptidase [Candidatus Sumerlaeota bacterium]|nr:M23 family metallopeptidase [Candidatus Sumerlaeota bacterium]
MADCRRIIIALTPRASGRRRRFVAPWPRARMALIALGALIAANLAGAAVWTTLIFRAAAKERQDRYLVQEWKKEAGRLRGELKICESEKAEIERIHDVFSHEADSRLKKMSEMLAQMEGVTGVKILSGAPIPLQGTALAMATRSATALKQAAQGRGGAAHPLLERINPETIEFYDPERLEELDQQTLSLSALYDSGTRALGELKKQAHVFAHTPLLAPIQTACAFTDLFGYRIHPITKKKDFHEGLDIAAPKGTTVVAPADGVVAEIGTSDSRGKYLILSHGKGAKIGGDDNVSDALYTTRFLHCSQILVKDGQRIQRGQVIATVGSTGVSTAPHLHYEVRLNGKAVNPLSYILDRKLQKPL